jgi:transposase InsO family protein
MEATAPRGNSDCTLHGGAIDATGGPQGRCARSQDSYHDCGRALQKPLDRVQRRFKASRPDELWVGDFTFVATWSGFVYVAFVIDVFARRID